MLSNIDWEDDLFCPIRLIALGASLGGCIHPIVGLIVAIVEPKVPYDTLWVNRCYELIDECNKIITGLFL